MSSQDLLGQLPERPIGHDFDLAHPVKSFLSTARLVAFKPKVFFAALPRRGNFGSPFVFALSCVEVALISFSIRLVGINWLLRVGNSVGASSGLTALSRWFFSVGDSIDASSAMAAALHWLFNWLVEPAVGVAVGLFLVASIAHLLVRLIVGPTNSGFEATFRASGYASVTVLVIWIPYVGPLVSLYWPYLATVGIRELHHTTTGKAAAVVLIPSAILVVLLVILLGALFSGMRGFMY